MQLSQAFRLSSAPRLALVGSGGKTTALFHLANELKRSSHRGVPKPVIVTATTHLAREQIRLANHHLVVQKPGDVTALEHFPPGVVLVTGMDTRDGRASGLDHVSLEGVLLLVDSRPDSGQIPILIEADGSRRLPLKAPADHEPSIPSFVNTVVVVAGLLGVGKPLNRRWVHRPQRFADLSGLSAGAEISPEAMVRVLAHPAGGLKNIPPGARRVVLLNQADTPELQAMGQSIAKLLLPSYDAVIVSALIPPNQQAFGAARSGGLSSPLARAVGGPPIFAVHESVAGIVLAAGESSRFGQSKQLLLWRGEPFVRQVAYTALNAGLSPVVVVTGADDAKICHALAGLSVMVVHNPDWEQGQSTSIQVGLRRLLNHTGGAVFLLADQPQVPIDLIRTLVETHSGSLAPVVVPLVGGRRANPVLFDRVTFKDLMALRGDIGGRALFSGASQYPVSWVPWHDAGLLLDVDTPADYKRLLELYT